MASELIKTESKTQYNQSTNGSRIGKDSSESEESRALTQTAETRGSRTEKTTGKRDDEQVSESTGKAHSVGRDVTKGSGKSERVSETVRSLSSTSDQVGRSIEKVNIGMRVSFAVKIRNHTPVSKSGASSC